MVLTNLQYSVYSGDVLPHLSTTLDSPTFGWQISSTVWWPSSWTSTSCCASIWQAPPGWRPMGQVFTTLQRKPSWLLCVNMVDYCSLGILLIFTDRNRNHSMQNILKMLLTGCPRNVLVQGKLCLPNSSKLLQCYYFFYVTCSRACR